MKMPILDGDEETNIPDMMSYWKESDLVFEMVNGRRI